VKCAEIKEVLPAYADDPETTLAVRRHLSRCPECKAELARYDELLDGLALMRTVAVEPPAGLDRWLVEIPNTLNRLDQVRDHVARNKRAYAGGVAVAVLGAAAAALWQTRRARPVPA
jgi:anti-sigma factor RsiW